jgi:hypothetical protein
MASSQGRKYFGDIAPQWKQKVVLGCGGSKNLAKVRDSHWSAIEGLGVFQAAPGGDSADTRLPMGCQERSEYIAVPDRMF